MDTSGAERRRIFNEGRRRLFGELERPIAFICECGDPGCAATVTLTAADYDAVRAAAPGHLLAGGHLPAELTPPPAPGDTTGTDPTTAT